MAWLLMPAEALRLLTEGDALDPRPYHAVSASLHAIYLLGVYWFLCRIRGRSWSVLVSFAVAVPTFLFFAFAAFLSLDILPGLGLIAMTFWMGRWLESPSRKDWLSLVVIGAAAALFKQTYGLFWVALLVAVVAMWLVPSWRATAPRGRATAWLAGGAFLSGLITWLVLSAVLGKVFGFGEIPFLLRPWAQIHTVTMQTHEAPWWIYIRNAPSFGLLTMILLVPGWWLSRRSQRPAIRISLVIVPVLLVFMHLIPYREVRYLVFLSPIAALLIVPAVEWLLSRRWTMAMLALLLIFELIPPYPWARLPEAVEIAQPFYRHSELREFVEAFRAHRGGAVFYQGENLGYRPQTVSKLVGDRRNEIFQFGPHQLYDLERIGSADFALVQPPQTAAAVPPGSLVVGANGTVLNVISWSHSARDEQPGRFHFINLGVGLRVEAAAAGKWKADDGSPVEIIEDGADRILSGDAVTQTLQGCVLPRIVVGDRVVADLRPRADGRFVIEGQLVDELAGVSEFLVIAQREVFRQTF